MENNQNSEAAPGWVGGFVDTDSKFKYSDSGPDLSSLPILDNLANIDLLQRQQAVKWPEFSWETVPGKKDSRCYRMFAPDISRLGYTNEGKVFSIICPQQGIVSPSVGSLNVEVTVTGQRGWVDETAKDGKTLAADMSVEAKIWFAPSAHQNEFVKKIWDKFQDSKLPFPFTKEHAIRVLTHNMDNPDQAEFQLTVGETDRFPVPAFAKHPEAWGVGHLDVQIAEIAPAKATSIFNHIRTKLIVDKFNKLIVGLFNKSAGNMLAKGNILSWNVWFTAPELVDQEEWANHAELWRESIQADHGSPGGKESPVRYFNGTPFEAGKPYPGAPKTRGLKVKTIEERAAEEINDIEAFLEEHFE